MIVDGENLVLGRVASNAASLAMDGEEIRIVNADRVVVTGDQDDIFGRYKEKYERGDKDHGPHFPRRPDRILNRTVRGMLPYSKTSGKEAYDRVKTYVGVPREFEDEDLENIEEAEVTSSRYVTLGEVGKYLGSNF